MPVRDAEFPPALEIYDFMFPESTENPPPIRIFEFPVFCSGTIVFSTLTRSDPSPEKPGHAVIQGSRPFVTAPTARLLTVNIQLFTTVGGVINILNFMMFIHHDSLLDGIGSPGPTLVPWKEWGPNKTRLLRMRLNSHSWVCYVHGTRFVCMERATHLPTENSRITLLDFNPLSIKRDLKLSEVESSRVTTFSASEPTVIDRREEVFVETVATSLPYREVFSADECHYEAVMINDDCLVGIRRGPMTVFDMSTTTLQWMLGCGSDMMRVNYRESGNSSSLETSVTTWWNNCWIQFDNAVCSIGAGLRYTASWPLKMFEGKP
ncbi:hypothetical protein BU17DRAFT_69338 [Hysterangium stoloniferum]|nr:hypothetical protein BU17DRAFT_69338 [Hysterangium stoloniferum]